MDSIAFFSGGVRRYILTAIDLKSRFAFAYTYPSLSSKNAADFMDKFKEVTPFKVERIQTDNGAEFEKHFRSSIEKSAITHFHSYPHHPQSNAHVERFNRTVREQHILWHQDESYEVDEFNKGLMEYLLWYNTEKPHKSLNKAPPLRYYVDTFVDPQESKRLWTLTRP